MGLFGKDESPDILNEQRDEELCNLQQALSTARGNVERMTIARTPEGMMKMAEQAAREIEDAFARGGWGRDQRFALMCKSIRRQIAIACGGEAIWSD